MSNPSHIRPIIENEFVRKYREANNSYILMRDLNRILVQHFRLYPGELKQIVRQHREPMEAEIMCQFINNIN